MALSPQNVRETEFKTSRRGYDPTEVDAFRSDVADALEAAQNEAAAMEARARAAVARLQELSKAQGEGPGDAAARADHGAPGPVPVDEAETISRTLLLAQRTADTTVAEAKADAERILAEAKADGERVIEEAKADGRRHGESERVRVEGEVQALLARRDFLEADVEHLEQFIAAQRERITEAVGELNDLVQRVPNGLADMRRPLLSAAADDVRDEGEDADIAAITEIAAADRDAADDEAAVDATGDVWAARDDTAEHALFERSADDDTN